MRHLHIVKHPSVQGLYCPYEARLRLAIDRIEPRLTPIISLFRRELVE